MAKVKTRKPVLPPEQFLSFIEVQLRKRGLTVSNTAGGFNFENDYLKGTLTLKPITITWKPRPGVEIMDVPLAVGNSSATFKNISEALTFLSLRLAKKPLDF